MCFNGLSQFDEFYQNQMMDLTEIDENWKDLTRAAIVGSALAVPTMFDKGRADDAQAQQTTEVVQQAKTYGGFTEEKAYNIVAKTLYDEARGEDIEGLKAVASVIYNRAGGDSQNFPAVCLKKYQFSCWNGLNDVERTPAGYYIVTPATSTQATKDMWGLCMELAKEMFKGEFQSTIDKRNIFYNPNKSSPNWGDVMKDPKIIGNHKFGYLPEYDGFKKKEKGAQVAKAR